LFFQKYEHNARTFWNDYGKYYPILSSVAKVFLLINASSSKIERAFSGATYLDDDRRGRLNCETFSKDLQFDDKYEIDPFENL